MSPNKNLGSTASREIKSAPSGDGNGQSHKSTPVLRSEESSNIRELVESLEQILFLISADWNRAYYVSPAFERVTGYARETLASDLRAWIEMVHPDDRGIVRETVVDRASGRIRGRVEMEYRITTAGGEIRWLRSVVSPIPSV